MEPKQTTYPQLLLFSPSEPFVARTAGRAVIGTCNGQMIGLAATHLRNHRFGVAVESPSVDTREDLVEGAEEAAERAEQLRAEQGHDLPPEAPILVIGRIKLVRDAIDKSLRDNAGQRELPVSGKKVLDPFHVGQALEATMEFMQNSIQEVSPLLIKEEAKALGITEDEVRVALASRPRQQAQFLHQNHSEILALCTGATATTKDGYELSLEQWQEALAMLEPMTQLKLIASADRALYRARNREIQEYARTGDPRIKSNLGLLDGLRRGLWAERDSWFKDPTFEAGVNKAAERGARLPDMGPKPAPVQPTEAEKALANRRAA